MSYTLAYQGAEIDDILGRAAPGGAIDQALATKQDALTFDDTPESGSDNPVKSGGIYDAIQAGGAAALGAYPTDSVSGDVVTFEDGADGIPVKSFVGSIIPQQNLNGQSAPYPAGGGKNKFQTTATTTTVAAVLFTVNSDGSVKPTRSGSSTANASLLLGTVTLPAGSYRVNGGNAVSDAYMTLRDGDTDAFIANITNADYALTVTEEHSYKLVAVVASNVTPTGTLKPMIRLVTETDATFAPYANICPISGWTGANIYRTGINLWDEEWEVGGIDDSTGAKISVTTQIRSKNYIHCIPSTAYFVKSPYSTYVYFYAADTSFLSRANVGGYDVKAKTITTPSDAAYMLFKVQKTASTLIYDNDISINYPSTDTSYHAYNGSTILLAFGQTVYAGTLTALGGGLWSVQPTHAIVGMGTLTWTASTVGGVSVFVTANGVVPNANASNNTRQNTFCSVLAWHKNTQFEIGDNYVVIDGNKRIIVRASSIADVTALNSVLSGQTLVYELATLPDPITITGEDLQTLLGSNTVWTDVGSVTGMTYRADTALYIQKLLNGGGTLSLSMASPSPSLSLGRVGVLAEPEEAEPEQTEEEAEQLEQTEEPEQTEEA